MILKIPDNNLLSNAADLPDPAADPALLASLVQQPQSGAVELPRNEVREANPPVDLFLIGLNAINNDLKTDEFHEQKPYDDKPRRRAYRTILAGLRFHKNEKLSFITIGFKRGSTVDVRTLLMKLTTWIKRDKDLRIDFYRVTVWDNNSPDEKWRVHTHIIWNAPYLKQSLIVEKIEKYLGETGSVYIKLLDGDDKRTARYLMQYLGNQDGFVRYSQSRGWLPKGYNAEWKALKQEFYQKVSTYPSSPLNSDKQVLQEMCRGSPEWRKEGLVGVMNLWIDEQRDKKNGFVQFRLDKNGEMYNYEKGIEI